MDRPIRNICCIGAGYVGGPTSAVIASKNPHVSVTVVDYNEERIQAWKTNQLPIFEPGLIDIIHIARDGLGDRRKPNLFFSTNVDQAIHEADLILVCVNTPTKGTGLGAGSATELAYTESAIRKIADVSTTDKIIVEKSTVPCRTSESIVDLLEANGRPGVHFEVLSNPEFLAEGTAIANLLNPDRILIGSFERETGLQAATALADIYSAWVPQERIITMNIWSCELSKLAANALLAQRISSINALSAMCEATGADIEQVAYACGLDTRIGPRMLQASVGFGGSCFKKDILSLAWTAETLHLGQVSDYWKSVVDMNEYQKDRFTKRVIRCLHNSLKDKKLAVLGFSYKKNTADTRETAALTVISSLLAEGADICIYDPGVKEAGVWRAFREAGLDYQPGHTKITVADTAYEACEDAYSVIILTEWDEFSNKDASSHNVGARMAARRYDSAKGSPTTKPASIPKQNGFHNHTNGRESPSSSATESRIASLASKKLEWERIAQVMKRPMYVFDGRNVVDPVKLNELGFHVERIGGGESALMGGAGGAVSIGGGRGSPRTRSQDWF